MTKIILTASIMIISLVGFTSIVGTWEGSGSVFDVIQGQFNNTPATLVPDVSIKSGVKAPYKVSVKIDASKAINQVSDAYLSLALDLSQVVGGKWWNPKADKKERGSGTIKAPIFDFGRPGLDSLTRALAPAYLRIGGSESDKTYYDMSLAERSGARPPEGYESVLTRGQWDAANQFAMRNNLKIIFTLNAGPSARNADGSWNPRNAETLLKYSVEKQYPISVWELGNEVNLLWYINGAESQVSPQQYAVDIKVGRKLVKAYFPGARFTGQGGAFWPIVGEPLNFFFPFTFDYIKLSGEDVDHLSWHYYPQQSRRGPIAVRRANPYRLLKPENLDEVAVWAKQIIAARNQYAPGKKIWMGETGNAQFGGEPGVSDVYLGGLWWLDQLGLLAQLQHEVVVRQTLAGLNYGMVDQETLEPKPDYWNSLLWKKLMGNKVFATEVLSNDSGKLRAYAHSAKPGNFDITFLLINLDHERAAIVDLKNIEISNAQIYRCTTPDIFSRMVLLNGKHLMIKHGTFPEITGAELAGSRAQEISLNPLSYCFVTATLQ